MVERRAHPYRAMILVLVAMLIGIGFMCFLSASYDATVDEHYPAPHTQIRWIAIGVVMFVAVQAIDYRTVGRYAFAIYAVIILLLVLTALFAPSLNRSRRWLPIAGSIGIQASEFMKVGLVLVLARVLRHVERGYSWRQLFLPVALVALPVGFVIRQPDLGMCLLYTPIIGVMVWASGVRRSVLITLVLIVGLGAPAAYVWGLKDYQRARIQTFVNWDEEKEGQDDLFQPLNARIAVANGGWFGMGLFRGIQNTGNRLPAKYSDYIFAVIAEETGLVGSIALMALFYLLVVLLFHAAVEFREPFGRLILVGVGGLIGTQVLVNAAVASGALPTTGLTLPLVSHGGSSMLTTCVLLGLAVNVLGRRRLDVAKPGF